MPVLPATPRGVTVAVAVGSATVRFTKPAGPNPISYYMATCTSSNGGWLDKQQHRGDRPRRAFGSFPASGKQYTCRVQAFNAVGSGPLSAASAAFTAR